MRNDQAQKCIVIVYLNVHYNQTVFITFLIHLKYIETTYLLFKSSNIFNVVFILLNKINYRIITI